MNATAQVTSTGSHSGAPGSMNDQFSEFHPKIASQMRELVQAKEHAVSIEDYQEAKRYKDTLENLKKVATRIGECESLKKEAVSSEDYDKAKQLKLEIDSLYRAALEGRVGAEGVQTAPDTGNAGSAGGSIGNGISPNIRGQPGSETEPGGPSGSVQTSGASGANLHAQAIQSSIEGVYAEGLHASNANDHSDVTGMGSGGGGGSNSSADHSTTIQMASIPPPSKFQQQQLQEGPAESDSHIQPANYGKVQNSPTIQTRGTSTFVNPMTLNNNNNLNKIQNNSMPGGNSWNQSPAINAPNNNMPNYPVNLDQIGPETDPSMIKGMDLFRSGGVTGPAADVTTNDVQSYSGGGGSSGSQGPGSRQTGPGQGQYNSNNSYNSSGPGGPGSGPSSGTGARGLNSGVKGSQYDSDLNSDLTQGLNTVLGGGPGSGLGNPNKSNRNHPLSGVSGQEDLPEPEPLTNALTKELAPLLNVFDEYLVSCLYSKTRILREAGLSKLHLDLKVGYYDPKIVNGYVAKDMLSALVMLLKRASVDKIANIFLLSMQVTQGMVEKVVRAGDDTGFYLKKQDTQPLLDSFVPILVEKLGDTNTRCSQTAGNSLLALALCPNVGCNFISHFLMQIGKSSGGASGGPGGSSSSNSGGASANLKKLPSRVYCNRIKILTYLIQEVGVREPGGLSLEPLMQLSMQWFDNPNHEVRQSIVEMVGVIYGRTNLQTIEPFLAHLRPTQREVFDAEFEQINGENYINEKRNLLSNNNNINSNQGPGLVNNNNQANLTNGGPGSNTNVKGTSKKGKGKSSSTRPGSASKLDANASPGGPGGAGAPGSASKLDGNGSPGGSNAAAQADVNHTVGGAAPGGGGEIAPFQCQFCRLEDPSFTPEGLDLHYWKDCPMLTECKYCQQVIEISGVRTHYMEECEKYMESQPVRTHYLEECEKYMESQPSPDSLPESGCCPLCRTTLPFSIGAVPEEEENIWIDHLVKTGCPQNPRPNRMVEPRVT